MREAAEFDVKDFDDVESAKGVYPKFYKRPKIDQAESDKQGRNVFKDVDYIEIVAVGNQNNIVDRPVTEMDKRRFAEQWSRYLSNSDQVVGTPLTEVAWILRSQVEDLSYRRIRTLEQLAELADNVCTDIPGLYASPQGAGSD